MIKNLIRISWILKKIKINKYRLEKGAIIITTNK